MEDGWKVRMNICTTLWSFVNFCCLSQSEVSTDDRKVSTFFAFQQVRCRCCYRSYLDRFLNNKSLNLHRKAKPYRILVVVVEWHHCANGLLQQGAQKCDRFWFMHILSYRFNPIRSQDSRRSSKMTSSCKWPITALSPKVWPLLIYSHSFVQI